MPSHSTSSPPSPHLPQNQLFQSICRRTQVGGQGLTCSPGQACRPGENSAQGAFCPNTFGLLSSSKTKHVILRLSSAASQEQVHTSCSGWQFCHQLSPAFPAHCPSCDAALRARTL
jgi:hypothetical protein